MVIRTMGEITTMDMNEARLRAFVCVRFANIILNERNLNETTHHMIYSQTTKSIELWC